jgi:hypothetical protein
LHNNNGTYGVVKSCNVYLDGHMRFKHLIHPPNHCLAVSWHHSNKLFAKAIEFNCELILPTLRIRPAYLQLPSISQVHWFQYQQSIWIRSAINEKSFFSSSILILKKKWSSRHIACYVLLLSQCLFSFNSTFGRKIFTRKILPRLSSQCPLSSVNFHFKADKCGLITYTVVTLWPNAVAYNQYW